VIAPPHEAAARIRAGYLEMPGLRLTPQQASRLFGVEPAVCRAVLEALVEMQFLCVKPNGGFARISDGDDTASAMPRQ